MKKKVLHISFGGLGNGGVTSVIMSIVSKLYQKYDFGCVVFAKKCEREPEFLKYGKIHRLKCYCSGNSLLKLFELFLRPFVMTFGVYKICKTDNYRIIHCHNGRDMLFPLLGAKLAHVPNRIAHSHNAKSPQKKSFFFRIYDSVVWFLVKKIATNFVGCSKVACEDFFRDRPYQVLNNAIDLSRFSWGQNKKEIIEFIHVGRFDYQKNQEFVINVFEKIKDKLPHSVLRLVGFGYDETKLRQIIASKKLSDRAFILDGHITDVPKLFTLSDCMIFPSVYEGFGIVLLEAQASGCYCFASDVCPSETNVGFMEQLPISIGEEEWAKKILKYFDNPVRDCEDSVKRNLKKFDADVIAERYDSLYAG